MSIRSSFIKRDIMLDITPMPEKVIVKEIEEPVRPGTSVAAYRGDMWEEQEELEVSPLQPAEAVAMAVHEEQEPDILTVEALVPVLAVARGRIFWRLTATSRRAEVASVPGNQPGPTPGTRSGRHGTGRLTRRPRGGWWRRRTSAGAQTDTANRPETPKAGENLGQMPGSGLA